MVCIKNYHGLENRASIPSREWIFSYATASTLALDTRGLISSNYQRLLLLKHDIELRIRGAIPPTSLRLYVRIIKYGSVPQLSLHGRTAKIIFIS
jgi:hypothetical protein